MDFTDKLRNLMYFSPLIYNKKIPVYSRLFLNLKGSSRFYSKLNNLCRILFCHLVCILKEPTKCAIKYSSVPILKSTIILFYVLKSFARS